MHVSSSSAYDEPAGQFAKEKNTLHDKKTDKKLQKTLFSKLRGASKDIKWN